MTQPPVGTHAEIRTAIALVRHMSRETNTATSDALAALQAAADDQGVRPEKVAIICARYAANHMQAGGIPVDFWASIALPASEDWEHES